MHHGPIQNYCSCFSGLTCDPMHCSNIWRTLPQVHDPSGQVLYKQKMPNTEDNSLQHITASTPTHVFIKLFASAPPSHSGPTTWAPREPRSHLVPTTYFRKNNPSLKELASPALGMRERDDMMGSYTMDKFLGKMLTCYSQSQLSLRCFSH